MTKRKIKFFLNSQGEKEKEVECFLEVEGDKIIIPLKIKKVGNENWNKSKLEQNYRVVAIYSIEFQEITFKEENEEKKAKIEDLAIVFEDLKNSLSVWPDEIFQEGAEVKLCLPNPKLFEEEKVIREGNDWYFEKDFRKKQRFSLIVNSNYEIITSTNTYSFPLTTHEDFQNKNLKENWEQRGEKEVENIKNNLSETSILNNISIVGVWRQSNPSNYAGEIKIDNKIGKAIDINLKQEQFDQVKNSIIKIISESPSDWRIFESGKEKVVFHSSFPPEASFFGGLKGKSGKIHYKEGFTEEEWGEIVNLVKNQNSKENNQNENNYTVENFKKWLNENKSRKKGLRGWNLVIAKVKSDQDLFNALATGKNIGGWNIADPQFRKEYKFEDYYQVFLDWKKDIDNQGSSENDNNFLALTSTNNEPEYQTTPHLPISSVETKGEKNTEQMPYGSVLLTDAGTTSELKNQGIDFIIHAAMMPLSKNRKNEKEFIKVATLAIQNSIILADRQKFVKLATCFLGGNIYCPAEEVKPILAEAIIKASLNQLEKCSYLKAIIFVDYDEDYYKNAWEKIKSEDNYSKIIKKTKVVKGDICEKSTHKAKVIINSENAEMEWRGGISGAIKKKLGSEADEIDRQRKDLMKEFYNFVEETGQNQTSIIWGIISSPWTWLIAITIVGLLILRKKLRSYF